MKSRLGQRILAPTLSIIAIGLVTTLVVTYLGARQAAFQESTRRLQRETELAGALIDNWIQAQLLDRRMQQAQFGEAFTRPIQAIVQQSLRLNRMLTALLDLSRIQTGQLVIERDWFDLRRLVERIVAEVSPTLSRHTLELVAAPDPLPIFADELR
ncbi:MAG: hypothetical protein EOM08_14140, partial [Clostridia bacterium]|nr:hypothetical protein [Clostridia bacterium]